MNQRIHPVFPWKIPIKIPCNSPSCNSEVHLALLRKQDCRARHTGTLFVVAWKNAGVKQESTNIFFFLNHAYMVRLGMVYDWFSNINLDILGIDGRWSKMKPTSFWWWHNSQWTICKNWFQLWNVIREANKRWLVAYVDHPPTTEMVSKYNMS